VLQVATSDRTEKSYTSVSNRVLCVACVYLLYGNCQYLLVEGNGVNDCVKLCGIV
jgi:hypothetical protein